MPSINEEEAIRRAVEVSRSALKTNLVTDTFSSLRFELDRIEREHSLNQYPDEESMLADIQDSLEIFAARFSNILGARIN